MELDWEFMRHTFFLALKGVPVALNITLVTLLISIPLGFVIAIVRNNKKHPWISKILAVYVSYNRGTPIIVQIYIIYNMLPYLIFGFCKTMHINFDIYSLDNVIYAYVVFSLSYIAFLSEAFRSGLGTVHKGQYEAAMVVGMSDFQSYRRIVVPQAITALLPILCTNITGLIKMTSLSFSMAIFDITAIAKVEASAKLCFIEAYLDITIIYVVLCLIVELIFKIIESKVKTHRACV